MKVLVAKGSKGTPADILTFTYAAGDFEKLVDGSEYKGKGVIAEFSETEVGQIVRARTKDSYLESGELNRDLKFIGKFCEDYRDGTEVACTTTSSAFKLIPDKAGLIDRTGKLAKGDHVAVGPRISPKALMNLHGTVVSIKGAKVEIAANEGDLDRLRRATGKKWGATIKMPAASVEKVA